MQTYFKTPKISQVLYYTTPTDDYQKFVNAFCKMRVTVDPSRIFNKKQLGVDANIRWKQWKSKSKQEIGQEIIRMCNFERNQTHIVQITQNSQPIPSIVQPEQSQANVVPFQCIPKNAVTQRTLRINKELKVVRTPYHQPPPPPTPIELRNFCSVP